MSDKARKTIIRAVAIVLVTLMVAGCASALIYIL